MPLKAIVDTLDDVPEAIRGEYAEEGGKFHLRVDGINEHPQVLNLKTAHERQKAKNAELTAKLSEATARYQGLPDDFTVEAYESLKAAAEGKGGQSVEEAARLRKQLEEKHAKDLASVQAQLESERSVTMKLLVDEGLTKALATAKVRPELMEGAQAVLRGMVKVADENGRRYAYVDTDMGPTPLDQFVSQWAASTGRAYVAPPSGGDAPGGHGGGNAKTITRAEFEKLDPVAKHKAMTKDGVTVVD